MKYTFLSILILCVAAIEIAIAFIVPRSSLIYNSSPLVEKDGLRMERQVAQTAPYAILLMGSSQTREDYDTSIMNTSLTKSKAVNLGVSGGDFIDLFLLSKKIISLRPSAVVYTTFVGNITKDYNVKPVGLDFSDLVTLMGSDSRCSFLGCLWKHRVDIERAFVEQLLPSFQYRNSLASTFFALLNHNKLSEPPVAASETSSYFTQQLNNPEIRYSTTPSTFLEEKAVTLFLNRMRENNIPVIFVAGPTYPGFEVFVDSGALAAYQKFLTRLFQGNNLLYIALDKEPNFLKSDFADFTHLNEFGRKKMSVFISQLLAKKGY